MKPFYRPLLAEAWKTTRVHLYIWPLAAFASVVGVLGEFHLILNVLTQEYSTSTIEAFMVTDFITFTFASFGQAFDLLSITTIQFADIPILALFLLMFIAAFAVAVIIISSEGGLYYSLGKIESKQKSTYLTSFKYGFDRFWTLLFIYMTYTLLFQIITILFIIPFSQLAITYHPLSRVTILLLIFFISIPVLIILHMVKRYSVMHIMLAEPNSKKHETFTSTLIHSLRDSWLLFRANWIISIETALILIVLMTVVLGLAVYLLIPLVIALFMFMALLANQAPGLISIIAFSAFVAVAAVLIFVIAGFTAFQAAVWVNVYKRLTTGVHHSKIHRALRHLPHLHKKII